MKVCWVEIDPDTLLPIRIFRNHKMMEEATCFACGPVKKIDRGLAVSQIRRQVWNRQEGVCNRCPNLISWTSAHLHEKIHRGMGGEVSLENSVLLCAECHLGSSGVHPERQLFTK